MRRLSAVSAAALVAGLLLAAAPSGATGTLDQSQTTTASDNPVYSAQTWGQTFTAGITGNIDQVDLALGVTNTPPNLTVQIRSVAATGEPTATVLGSGSISMSSPGGTVCCTFTSAPINNAPVTAGTQYAIVLLSTGDTNNIYRWAQDDGGDLYTRGVQTFSNDAGATWSVMSSTGLDFGFKTYVVTPPPPSGGYLLAAADGGIFSFGNAKFLGSTGGMTLNNPIVGLARTPDGQGYWLVASDGGIFSFGTAKFLGSTGGLTLNNPVVGMAATPDGQGYWLVASDGGIFSYGTAKFLGSTGATTIAKPIVGMAATPDGQGYRLVASDGGIFSYGTATFLGSTGSTILAQPIVGMA